MESKTKDSSNVLFKALQQTIKQLGINDDEIMAILQLNTFGELQAFMDKGSINSDSQTGQIALQVTNIGVSLWKLNGGDKELMKHFLRTNNHETQGKPIDQMKSPDGLSTINTFLCNLV